MNRNKVVITALSFLILLSLAPDRSMAQQDNRYNLANRLFQQGEYREALPLFRQLYREQPGTYLFLERTAECLIRLNRYEEAVSFTKNAIGNSHFPGQSSVLLGRIYHTKGDTTRAYSVWDRTIREYPGNFQVYLLIGRAMANRRSFGRAIEVYQKAEKRFSRSTLLSTEMAGTYMQAGRYEDAINEFLELVKQEPNRIDYVQRTLMRYDDSYLFDTAILELKEFLDQLPLRHKSYRNLHQLRLWLLMERELYERALTVAKSYEAQTSQRTYALYELASKLLAAREFSLAEAAYRFYINGNDPTAKYRSMEELSGVYLQWANYLENYNLAYSGRRDTLYHKAFDTLELLTEEAPFYSRMGRVLIRQAELALDYMHNVELARRYLQKLNKQYQDEQMARRLYLEGRIHLYEGDYDRARILFNRSSKQEQAGELKEETAYYRALSDFYAGSYEFAKIQLKSLERQGTSYFANDALRLRVWIQEGTQDSTNSLIKPFAEAIENLNHGQTIEALKQFQKMTPGQSYHPLTDDLLLELGKQANPELIPLFYSLTSRYLNRWGNRSPLRERLMWEKARIADQVVTRGLAVTDTGSPYMQDVKAVFSDSSLYDTTNIPSTREALISLYEQILLTFPDGFYASFARNRIQELKHSQT